MNDSTLAPSLPSQPFVLPRLTQAQAPLTQAVDVINERGETEQVHIPAERPLTVYVDRRELVTLMTLGAHPELLVLGYLRNQRLVASAAEVESITVDWDVGAAAVRTHAGVADLAARTAHRVVTTGCGQGTVFGGVMDQIGSVRLPDVQTARIRQGTLYRMLETMRWVQWLEEEQRHLVWMRAKRYEWHQIGRRFACDRNTAARRWKKAMQLVADKLNGSFNSCAEIGVN